MILFLVERAGVLTDAIDINNDGQIVGNGYLDGAVREFL